MPPDAAPTGVVDELEREINAIQGTDALTVLLESLTELDEPGRHRLFDYCKERCSSILTSLKDVVMDGDETEAVMMLPGLFLELRFEWSRYNSQIQYQNILRGGADPALMGRSSVISQIVRAVELALTAEHAFWVNRIAADPITSVASRGTTVKRLLGLALSARDGQKRALESLDELGKVVTAGNVNPGLTIAVERAKEKTLSGSDNVIVMHPTEIHDILELLVVEKLAGRQMRVLVNQGDVDSRVNVLPEVVLALREVAAQWLETLLKDSVEASADEREQLGKSAHLNLRWSLRIVHTRLYFHLEDDGCGTVSADPQALPDITAWAHLRLRVDNEQTPGQGGKLAVTCEASSFSSFLICALKLEDQTGNLNIAVVTTSVLSILSRAHRANTGLPLIEMPDGSLIRIVDLRDAWPNLAIAPAQEKSVFIVISTERSGLIALRVDEIPDAVRAVVLTTASASPDVLGFVSLKDGLAIVIDPDRLAPRLSAHKQLNQDTGIQNPGRTPATIRAPEAHRGTSSP